MNVLVSSGSVQVDLAVVAVTGATKTITAADASNPRYDIISVHTDGTLVVTAGTPAVAPAVPAVPTGDTEIALVYVPAAVTSIVAANIGDRRALLGVSTPAQVGLAPTAAPAALVDNSGGAAADGTIGSVTLPTFTWNGSSVYPTAAQGTAINAAFQALMDAVKELSTENNALITALKASKILT